MNRRKKAFTFCGTPEYLAPQIIKGSGHDRAVDWWSLGALMYEMLTGAPPFFSKNRKEVFDNILTKPPQMKRYFSSQATDLLRGLLTISPAKRLGGGEADSEEIKNHPFFMGIDWNRMWIRGVAPPYIPLISANSTQNIDKMFLNEPAMETPVDNPFHKASKPSNNYEDFTYQDDR